MKLCIRGEKYNSFTRKEFEFYTATAIVAFHFCGQHIHTHASGFHFLAVSQYTLLSVYCCLFQPFLFTTSMSLHFFCLDTLLLHDLFHFFLYFSRNFVASFFVDYIFITSFFALCVCVCVLVCILPLWFLDNFFTRSCKSLSELQPQTCGFAANLFRCQFLSFLFLIVAAQSNSIHCNIIKIVWNSFWIPFRYFFSGLLVELSW